MDIGHRFKQIFKHEPEARISQLEDSNKPHSLSLQETLEELELLHGQVQEALDNSNLILYHQEFTFHLETIEEHIKQVSLCLEETQQDPWVRDGMAVIPGMGIVEGVGRNASEQEGPDARSVINRASWDIQSIKARIAHLKAIADQDLDERYFQGLGNIVLSPQLYYRGEEFDPGVYVQSERVDYEVGELLRSRYFDVPNWIVPEMNEIEQPGVTVGMYNLSCAKAEELRDDFDIKEDQFDQAQSDLLSWFKETEWRVPQPSQTEIMEYATTLDDDKPVEEALSEARDYLQNKISEEMAPVIKEHEEKIQDGVQEMMSLIREMNELVAQKDALFEYSEDSEELSEDRVEEQ